MTGTPKFDMTLVALQDMREFFSNPRNWWRGGRAFRGVQDGDKHCLLTYSRANWHGYVSDYLNERAVPIVGAANVGELLPAARFNDSCTHEQLLTFLDEAIAAHQEAAASV